MTHWLIRIGEFATAAFIIIVAVVVVIQVFPFSLSRQGTYLVAYV